jgi:hypothetical protein
VRSRNDKENKLLQTKLSKTSWQPANYTYINGVIIIIIIIIIIINNSIYLVLVRILVHYLLFRLKAGSFFQCLIIIFLTKKIKK